MVEQEKLRDELKRAKEEHRLLDTQINESTKDPSSFDQLQLQRMKKRKLWLKDRIAEIEMYLYDDIIA